MEAYILHHAKVQAQVHKTDRYLVINFSINGELKTVKIDLPGSVLYCLDEESFKPLWEQMQRKFQVTLDEEALTEPKQNNQEFRVTIKFVNALAERMTEAEMRKEIDNIVSEYGAGSFVIESCKEIK